VNGRQVKNTKDIINFREGTAVYRKGSESKKRKKGKLRKFWGGKESSSEIPRQQGIA